MTDYRLFRLTGDMAQRALAYMSADRPKDTTFAELDNGVITITQIDPQALPRAYNHFPHLSPGYDKQGNVAAFMWCPVDYKGDSYIPENAEEIPESDIISISDSGEIVRTHHYVIDGIAGYKPSEGTALPADFDPQTHNISEYGIQDITHKVFIAAGRSLHIIEDHLRRIKDHNAAKKALETAVLDIASSLKDSIFLGMTDDGLQNMSITLQESKEGERALWFSAHTGMRKDTFNQSSLLMVCNNAHFKVTDFNGIAYRIEPNTDTVEGKTLQRLFDRLSRPSDIGAYWQLHNPTAPTNLTGHFHSKSGAGVKAPKLETVGGVHYLIYLVAESGLDACYPPDSIPVNPREYFWRKADEQDIKNGIKPPPVPPELSYMQPVKPIPSHLANRVK